MQVELVAGRFVDEKVGRYPELDAQVEPPTRDAMRVEGVPQVKPSSGS